MADVGEAKAFPGHNSVGHVWQIRDIMPGAESLEGGRIRSILAKVKDVSVISELLKHMSSEGFDEGRSKDIRGDVGFVVNSTLMESSGKRQDFKGVKRLIVVKVTTDEMRKLRQLFALKKTPSLRHPSTTPETFSKAWERFKELLRACPHHRFMELTQVDTFYNGLNENEQDSLNAAAGGNLLSKMTREALNIIENKSKVRYSRNRSNSSRMNTTSSKTDERIDKLADQLSTLVEIVSKKVVTLTPVKAVEESCVTCCGTHAWYNCSATDNNQASVCATTGTYNQVNPPNRVSNQMAPPGFSPVKNNGQNRFNQNQVQGNNFNRGNNFHGNQASTSGILSSNTIPNPEGEMKAITTRSGVAYEGPSIPTNPSPKEEVERETEETTDKEQTNF
ncbi:hypothetical protein Tco_1201847 [Tanacetum coccineum]